MRTITSVDRAKLDRCLKSLSAWQLEVVHEAIGSAYRNGAESKELRRSDDDELNQLARSTLERINRELDSYGIK